MKIHIRNLPIVSAILLILLVISSACSPSATTVLDTAPPSPTAEPSATSTSSPPPPTPTSTPLPPTATLTPTATHTLTPTPTSEPPALTVDQNVACRTGPGLIYDIRAYLPQGSTPLLLGKVGDQSWWMVEEPEFKANCWVSSEVASLQGEPDLLPVFTPEPTPTQVPSPTQKEKGMRVYLVNLNTGGPFGCGDGLVYFSTGKQRTDNVGRNIGAALNALFKLKTKYVGEFYNPVYNAHLYVNGVDVNEQTGNVYVYLAGSIPKPPDECEAKRIHDQVWETVRNVSGYQKVTIRVGTKLLGDLIAVGDR
ncbi:MAG: hypothetical protein ACK2UE_11615 [Anaerolineales bacterium]